MFGYGMHSLWGVLVLIGDIWAIINIFNSSASNEKKALWIIVVILLPLIGLILWYFLGPRDGKAWHRSARRIRAAPAEFVKTHPLPGPPLVPQGDFLRGEGGMPAN